MAYYNQKPFALHIIAINSGVIWFRIFGWGLVFKWLPLTEYGLLYSERNKLVPILKIGNLLIRPLKPIGK